MDGFLDVTCPTLSGMTTNVLDNVTLHKVESVAVGIFDGFNFHLVVLTHTALLFTYP